MSTKSSKQTSAKTRTLVFTAILAALTTAFTLISIPLPFGGYFNFGDLVIFIAAILLGPVYGAIVGGIGATLGDLILGYIFYMPFTLVIKAIEGLIVGFLYVLIKKFSKDKNSKNVLEIIFVTLANLLAGFVMALGYFLAEGLLLSEDHWVGGIAQLPLNTLQGAISALVAVALLYAFQLKRVFDRYFYKNLPSKQIDSQEQHDFNDAASATVEDNFDDKPSNDDNSLLK
ncbi:MAG: ECF transporter S component [Clostridia bacterium]|nr:ECF transporter S component [Clostridia bacterium]MDE7329162.1 ECF transporter S component [Clostridia bacterium]